MATVGGFVVQVTTIRAVGRIVFVSQSHTFSHTDCRTRGTFQGFSEGKMSCSKSDSYIVPIPEPMSEGWRDKQVSRTQCVVRAADHGAASASAQACY